MNKRILLSILAILFGVFFILFGGMDDSPGAQGIGVLIIIAVVFIAIKGRGKK